MRITRRQLRRIIREVKLNEAPSSGLMWFQEGTPLYRETMRRDHVFRIREENGGVWVLTGWRSTETGEVRWGVTESENSWCQKRGSEQALEVASPADWFAAAQDYRAGRPLRPELKTFEVDALDELDYYWVLGRIMGADLSLDPSTPGFTGCAKKKKASGPGPYLEFGSISELMDLDPEEFLEVDGLIGDYSTLSAAQKLALSKIEDIGFEGASVKDFQKVLKQVGAQNFLSAFSEVGSTISQIEYGSADELYSFYNDVARIAKGM